jgi:hypothetical protein
LKDWKEDRWPVREWIGPLIEADHLMHLYNLLHAGYALESYVSASQDSKWTEWSSIRAIC